MCLPASLHPYLPACMDADVLYMFASRSQHIAGMCGDGWVRPSGKVAPEGLRRPLKVTKAAGRSLEGPRKAQEGPNQEGPGRTEEGQRASWASSAVRMRRSSLPAAHGSLPNQAQPNTMNHRLILLII